MLKKAKRSQFKNKERKSLFSKSKMWNYKVYCTTCCVTALESDTSYFIEFGDLGVPPSALSIFKKGSSVVIKCVCKVDLFFKLKDHM